MCGIVGLFQTQRGDLAATFSGMLQAIERRGPDDAGTWHEPGTRLILGHRRLSIMDLSPNGHQPMTSASGRYVVTFNGEIYNFAEIRQALPTTYPFRGSSDTEVMLAAFEAWGVTTALRAFVGMFAFGVWDRQERTLTLARDRLGEKPLYYGWSSAGFIFASELAPFERHPLFDAPVDRDALRDFLRLGYITAPRSIYLGTYKLIPGASLTLSERELASRPPNFNPDPEATHHAPRPTRYWSLADVANRSPATSPLTESDVVAELERLVSRAVTLQMVADVPLGAFLSGGIDSSAIVALMQAHSTRPVKTFSIGFDTPGFDEAPHAAAVARHLKTDHTTLYLSPTEALDVIATLPNIYSEPLGDSSQIPTFLVARLARQHVTVALSGDGGDELFGGYPWYARALRMERAIQALPDQLRRSAAPLLRLAPLDSHLFGRVWTQVSQMNHRLHRLADLLEAGSPISLYRRLRSSSPATGVLVRGTTGAAPDSAPPRLDGRSFLESMLHDDTTTYLPDDILTKLDRAGMAVSLESRIPLLDHRVVEFAWSLPPTARFGMLGSKGPLRRLLHHYVPPALVDRPKMGFSIPLSAWLRGPLRPWVEDLLAAPGLSADGFLVPEVVRSRWDEHLLERRNNSELLWNILTFKRWLDERPRRALAPHDASPAVSINGGVW